MSAPRPYLTRRPGELIRASDWNEFQRRFRAELASHNHTGGEQGLLLDGKSFDPDSDLRVAELHVADKLIVGGRDVGAEVAKLPASDGRSLPSDLVVKGNLTVGGTLHSGEPQVLRASIKPMTELSVDAPKGDAELLSLSFGRGRVEVYLVALRAVLRGVTRPDISTGTLVWCWTLRLKVELGAKVTYHELGYQYNHYGDTLYYAHLRFVLPVVAGPTGVKVSLVAGSLTAMVEALELVGTPLLGGANG